MLRTSILALAFLSAGPALSCGNPLLWSMLFARVPQAEEVYNADLTARRNKKLEARVYVPHPLMPSNYHQWSAQWIKDAAILMDADIQSNLAPGETYTLLLADAVVAINFVSGALPHVTTSAGLDFLKGFDAITTVNALESGLNHGVTMSEMVELGVWVPQARATERRVAGIF